ncbi:hypothetical protein ACFLYF_04965 [Chloroflexota bacterium]
MTHNLLSMAAWRGRLLPPPPPLPLLMLPTALVGLVNHDVRDTKLADLKIVCDGIDQLRKDILRGCGLNGQQEDD